MSSCIERSSVISAWLLSTSALLYSAACFTEASAETMFAAESPMTVLACAAADEIMVEPLSSAVDRFDTVLFISVFTVAVSVASWLRARDISEIWDFAWSRVDFASCVLAMPSVDA